MFIIIGRVKKKGAIEFAAGNVSSRFFLPASLLPQGGSSWSVLTQSDPGPTGSSALFPHQPTDPVLLPSCPQSRGITEQVAGALWVSGWVDKNSESLVCSLTSSLVPGPRPALLRPYLAQFPQGALWDTCCIGLRLHYSYQNRASLFLPFIRVREFHMITAEIGRVRTLLMFWASLVVKSHTSGLCFYSIEKEYHKAVGRSEFICCHRPLLILGWVTLNGPCVIWHARGLSCVVKTFDILFNTNEACWPGSKVSGLCVVSQEPELDWCVR